MGLNDEELLFLQLGPASGAVAKVSFEDAVVVEAKEIAAAWTAVVVLELFFYLFAFLVVGVDVTPCLQREEDGEADDKRVDDVEYLTLSS